MTARRQVAERLRVSALNAFLSTLTRPFPTSYDKAGLDNAEKNRVPPEVIVDIARRFDITPESFDVLNGMERITDPEGKSFFLIPPGTSGQDAQKAALTTYILNAGTGYGPGGDFAPTPYAADEVQRIINRQSANSWSYDEDVAFVDRHGGRLVTTPNGMLMGLGGDWLQNKFSLRGGTTWGDIFMVNIAAAVDPAGQLRKIVESGNGWAVGDDGVPRPTRLDLDRLLHHEERHSQQWARLGYLPFITRYLALKPMEWWTGLHPFEQDAGLSDGGYR